jgi:hypothetical protein
MLLGRTAKLQQAGAIGVVAAARGGRVRAGTASRSRRLSGALSTRRGGGRVREAAGTGPKGTGLITSATKAAMASTPSTSVA